MGSSLSRNHRQPMPPQPNAAIQSPPSNRGTGATSSPRGTRDGGALRSDGADEGEGLGDSGAQTPFGEPSGADNPEPRLLQAILKTFSGYRTRALAFAAVGILLNAYGATHGRREWVVRYDGSLYQAAAAKLLKPVVTLSLGFGTPNALLSGVTCFVLLIGIVFGRPLLCLPSLLLSVCELIGDVSDALVAAGLLLAHLGVVPATLYTVVAVTVIAIELFLWHGVFMFYESGIINRLRTCSSRRSESTVQTPSRRISKGPTQAPTQTPIRGHSSQLSTTGPSQ